MGLKIDFSGWDTDFSFGLGRAVRGIVKCQDLVLPTNFSRLNV